MVDKVSTKIRSKIMASVRRADTAPELEVRRELFALGYRYRLHRRDLPGSPDIVLQKFGVAVFVHGCFWHGHNCPRGRRPKSNTAFWNKKLEGNAGRDRRNTALLKAMGWRVCVIWECAIPAGIKQLVRLLTKPKPRVRRVS